MDKEVRGHRQYPVGGQNRRAPLLPIWRRWLNALIVRLKRL